ncbi:MAG: hypothetical protein H6659_04450 [Ardenticatenaceae bacterium]|nr:hypothetical protein [Ardenticatenaceae bacterium]MCB8987658.1 hypothetical protein [Ardenticatenaceae bacterium]
MAEQLRAMAVTRFGADGRLPLLLRQSWPAFYLGSVAADCQDLAGVPRTATHFYNLPPDPDNQAYPRMLAAYPELADPDCMPPDQAAFVAAYSVHLMVDLVWFREILLPFFVNRPEWRDGYERRHLVHNIVLTYLDQKAYEALPETAVSTLTAAVPAHWLPFVDDAALVLWRDRLVAQLEPEGSLETVAVYAQRLHMSAEEFAACLRDPAWMAENVFNMVPIDEVQARLDAALVTGLDIMIDYLKIMDAA